MLPDHGLKAFWSKGGKYCQRGKYELHDVPRLPRRRIPNPLEVTRSLPFFSVSPSPHQKSFCCSSHPRLAGRRVTANLQNSCDFFPPFLSAPAAPAWMPAVGAGELQTRSSPCHFPSALSCAALKPSTHACNIFIMALLLEVFLCSPKLL